MKILPEKLNWGRTSGTLWRFFLFIIMLRFCFQRLSLAITVPFFFKLWHAWRSSDFTSWPVRDNAWQTLVSRISSPIDTETGLIPSDSWWWYWALLVAFLSNKTILSLGKRSHSHFLLTVSSEKRFYIASENHRNNWRDQIA